MSNLPKILFFGFSVTAENGGYVEKFENLSRSVFSVSKIGLGGIHPHHAKYLLSKHVLSSDADICVIEWSTSSFRQFLSKDQYIDAVLFSLIAIQAAGKTPVLLDLPRNDVDYESDWVSNLHDLISKTYSIPRLNCQYIIDDNSIELDDMLRDVVHTSEAGAEKYAELLFNYFESNSEQFRVTGNILDLGSSEYFYNSISIAELVRDDTKPKSAFQRSGYVAESVELNEFESIDIKLPRKYCIDGVSYVMGPRSGKFQMTYSHGVTNGIIAYDQFCYYDRLGATCFSSVSSDQVKIMQLDEIVDCNLLKGERDASSRSGRFIDLYVSKPIPEKFSELVTYFSEIVEN